MPAVLIALFVLLLLACFCDPMTTTMVFLALALFITLCSLSVVMTEETQETQEN